MDQITSRLEANLRLTKVNADKINNLLAASGSCPNEERVTKVEGNLDQVALKIKGTCR